MIVSPAASARATAKTGDLIAPVGGINVSDSITALKPGFALRLENLVCRKDGVATRKGHVSVMTQIGGSETPATVTAILTHDRQRFAATAGTIYRDRTPVATGLGAGHWHSTHMVNGAGRWLIACNGTAAPRAYNGTTWGASSITGVDESTFALVAWHQRRLFFAPLTGLVIWYLPVNAMHGAAEPIYMDQMCTAGGNVGCIAWLRAYGRQSRGSHVSEGRLALVRHKRGCSCVLRPAAC